MLFYFFTTGFFVFNLLNDLWRNENIDYYQTAQKDEIKRTVLQLKFNHLGVSNK